MSQRAPQNRPDVQYSSLLQQSLLGTRRWGMKTVLPVVLTLLVLLTVIGCLLWVYVLAPERPHWSQSPVDIVTNKAVFDAHLHKAQFHFNYPPGDAQQIVNTGGGWKIVLNPKLSNSTLEVVHLPGTYKLLQIHAHWDTGPYNGSEHTVDGQGYEAEVHFVHLNTKYRNVHEALEHKDGLAVLAVFLEQNRKNSTARLFDVLKNLMSYIEYKGDQYYLNSGGAFNLNSMIPEKTDFWTYNGSLTTPPYAECVIWTVFRTPVPVQEEQLQAFRTLKYCERVSNNTSAISPCLTSHGSHVRPTQPLNDRVIKASFEKL